MSQTNQILPDIAGKAARTREDSACDKDSELQTNGSSCVHSSACALTGQKDSCTRGSERIHHCRDDDNGEGTSSKTFPWNVKGTNIHVALLCFDGIVVMACVLSNSHS